MLPCVCVLTYMKMADAPHQGQKKNEAEKVCVTGSAGYVGSSLVKRLLQLGYVVHATVRNPGDTAKVQHLLNLPGASENLRLFKADLCDKGSFDAAIAGCRGVFHTATPTIFEAEDPEEEIIKPAVEGTLNVLESCRKAGTVKRVVITASGAALPFKDPRDLTEYIDESSWSDVNFLRTQKPPGWAYAVSKTEAERAALEYGNANGVHVISVVAMLVVGPWLTPTVPGSVAMAMSPLIGQARALEALRGLERGSGSVTLVHVDDLCDAHVFLYNQPSASGRHVCCAMCVPLVQLAQYLHQRYPALYAGATQLGDVNTQPRMRISSQKLVDMGFRFSHAELPSMLDGAVEQLSTVLQLKQKSHG